MCVYCSVATAMNDAAILTTAGLLAVPKILASSSNAGGRKSDSGPGPISSQGPGQAPTPRSSNASVRSASVSSADRFADGGGSQASFNGREVSHLVKRLSMPTTAALPTVSTSMSQVA